VSAGVVLNDDNILSVILGS